jgi:Lrp/AsnC family transcriptional regulator, regulator for asnA, asnC and gidA
MNLDHIDLGILELLEEDGRRPNADIARNLEIAESTVRKRIDRLIQANVFRTVIIPDAHAVGLMGHLIVGIHAELGKAQGIADRLSQLNEVRFVALTTGAFDLIAEVYLPSVNDFLRFIDRELARIEGIKGVATSTVLQQPKSRYNWIEMLRAGRYAKEDGVQDEAMPEAQTP